MLDVLDLPLDDVHVVIDDLDGVLGVLDLLLDGVLLLDRLGLQLPLDAVHPLLDRVP